MKVYSGSRMKSLPYAFWIAALLCYFWFLCCKTQDHWHTQLFWEISFAWECPILYKIDFKKRAKKALQTNGEIVTVNRYWVWNRGKGFNLKSLFFSLAQLFTWFLFCLWYCCKCHYRKLCVCGINFSPGRFYCYMIALLIQTLAVPKLRILRWL